MSDAGHPCEPDSQAWLIASKGSTGMRCGGIERKNPSAQGGESHHDYPEKIGASVINILPHAGGNGPSEGRHDRSEEDQPCQSCDAIETHPSAQKSSNLGEC
jgi:hypothetical protein